MYMKYGCFHISLSMMAIALWAAHPGIARGQNDEHREYLSVMELGASDLGSGLPEGWRITDGSGAEAAEANGNLWRVEPDSNGNAAICLTPEAQPLSLVSPPVPMEEGCAALSGVVIGNGDNEVSASLQWLSKDEVVATVPLREPPVSDARRRRFNLAESPRPETADGARLLVTAAPTEGATFCCTAVRLTGMFAAPREVSLFYNKIGYEQVAPKFFTVQANFPAERAVFSLTDPLGLRVFSGTLSPGKTVKGANGVSWEGYYYQGNFSFFEEEGDYTLTVELDQCEPVSADIRVGFNLLWHEAFALALAPFRQLRVENDDDDKLRLWRPAFLGGVSDAALLWDIVRSCCIVRLHAQTDAFVPLREEALYGLERMARWLDNGNSGVNQDEQALHAAIMACGARLFPKSDLVMAAARRLTETIMTSGQKGILPFSAVMDMYEATKESRYLEHGRRIFPGISTEYIDPLLIFESYTDTMITIPLSNHLGGLADRIVGAADNPFGLAMENGGFFLWETETDDPLRGNNARLLSIVEVMAQACRYAAKPEYTTFVYNQFNWIMGNNPYGVCLIVGLCEPDAPFLVLPENATLEQPYGAVLHGVGPVAPDTDRPFFGANKNEAAESTHGFSLYNNARYISAMAHLKRIPVAPPLKQRL